MNDQNAQLNDLAAIRSLMDKSSRFISLSGFSGIFVGIYALIGAGIAYFKFGYRDDLGFYNERTAHSFEPNKLFPFIIADATIVLILSLITAWYFTNRRAKKNNVKLFNKPGLKLISNLFIPLVTGGLFCLILLSQHLLFLIAPSMLIFYGLALINGSKFTLDEIRYLGFMEIALGLIAAANPKFGLLSWCIGFGILHILYGAFMWNKYERTEK